MSAIMATRNIRNVKKVDKPKPLKIIPLRHSTPDVPGQLSINSMEDILCVLDAVSSAISKKNLNEEMAYHTSTLITKLKIFGQRLEESYKDQLDKAFTQFRNGSKDDTIDIGIRSNLLHLIELRAMQWSLCASINAYYLTRCCFTDVGENSDIATPVSSNNVLLSPGELIKSTGKYSSPTKVPGKNYFKDEVVIRNCDSGKVMGIKGRRVHMIEELSETVISFQRVSPGAKERIVQITGPEEDKIFLAKQLIEDTIKRNASPIREVEKEIGSNSSLNSSASDDSAHIGNNTSGKMMNVLSSKDEGYEYKHSVLADGKTIRLSSNSHELIKWAKLLLEDAIKKEEKVNDGPKYVSKQTQTIVSNINDIAIPDDDDDVDDDVVGTPQRILVEHVPPENDNVKKNETTKIEVNEPTKRNVLHRKHSVRLIQYTKDFLLDLSCCTAASKPPPDWDKICIKYPDIIKQEKSLFDPVLYTKKWLENDGKSVLVNENFAYVDSD